MIHNAYQPFMYVTQSMSPMIADNPHTAVTSSGKKVCPVDFEGSLLQRSGSGTIGSSPNDHDYPQWQSPRSQVRIVNTLRQLNCLKEALDNVLHKSTDQLLDYLKEIDAGAHSKKTLRRLEKSPFYEVYMELNFSYEPYPVSSFKKLLDHISSQSVRRPLLETTVKLCQENPGKTIGGMITSLLEKPIALRSQPEQLWLDFFNMHDSDSCAMAATRKENAEVTSFGGSNDHFNVETEHGKEIYFETTFHSDPNLNGQVYTCMRTRSDPNYCSTRLCKNDIPFEPVNHVDKSNTDNSEDASGLIVPIKTLRHFTCFSSSSITSSFVYNSSTYESEKFLSLDYHQKPYAVTIRTYLKYLNLFNNPAQPLTRILPINKINLAIKEIIDEYSNIPKMESALYEGEGIDLCYSMYFKSARSCILDLIKAIGEDHGRDIAVLKSLITKGSFYMPRLDLIDPFLLRPSQKIALAISGGSPKAFSTKVRHNHLIWAIARQVPYDYHNIQTLDELKNISRINNPKELGFLDLINGDTTLESLILRKKIKNKQLYWFKILVIKNAFDMHRVQEGEWVVWFDNDVVINDFFDDRSVLDAIINSYPPPVSLIVAQDGVVSPSKQNTGIMLVRNDKKGREIINTLWKMSDDVHMGYKPQPQSFHEQEALSHIIQRKKLRWRDYSNFYYDEDFQNSDLYQSIGIEKVDKNGHLRMNTWVCDDIFLVCNLLLRGIKANRSTDAFIHHPALSTHKAYEILKTLNVVRKKFPIYQEFLDAFKEKTLEVKQSILKNQRMNSEASIAELIKTYFLLLYITQPDLETIPLYETLNENNKKHFKDVLIKLITGMQLEKGFVELLTDVFFIRRKYVSE